MTKRARARRITAVAGPDADALERLHIEYCTAFRRYVSRRDEVTLRAAYEIGREAVVSGVSVLDLAQIHHRALLRELVVRDRDDFVDVADAASRFFTEMLGTVEMTQRGLREMLARQQPDSTGGTS